MIFLQETHMYEKIKKFGYTNSIFHSHNIWRRRGVIILISNTGNIEMIEEDEDKEGRYMIVKDSYCYRQHSCKISKYVCTSRGGPKFL